MKFRMPSSTGRQIGLIVVGSISLAHVLFAGSWMIVAPYHRLSPPDRGLAAQIGLVVRMDLTLPIDQRSFALAAASNPKLLISQTFQKPDFGDFIPPNQALLDTIRDEVNAPGIEVLAGPPDPLQRGVGRADHAPIRIAVRVAEKEWLVFGVVPQPHSGPWSARNFPLTAILMLGLPLGAITLWAARRVTSPLARLAEATARLSPAGAEQAIPEEGTEEIQQVARAFNTILARLHKFVADRTGMLAAISHDLRTPLTRLRLRTELLRDEAMRNKMLKDIRAMDVMIASTLAYITQERSTETIEEIDLAALLQTLADDFSDAGFDVAYVGPLHCAAPCRPQALERALNNLIDNAIKFGEMATLVLDTASGIAVIDVEDDGPGIAENEKEQVLKPFYRTDSARGEGGVGLGLAIANTIIQGHGGTMELRDRQPHGLCVRVRIPRSERFAVMPRQRHEHHG
jgi:signal transduction histidine kinase